MSHTTCICLKIPWRMRLPNTCNCALRTVPLSLCSPHPPRGKRLSPPVHGGGSGVSRALFSYKVQQTLVNGLHKALNRCFVRHRELPPSGQRCPVPCWQEPAPFCMHRNFPLPGPIFVSSFRRHSNINSTKTFTTKIYITTKFKLFKQQ